MENDEKLSFGDVQEKLSHGQVDSCGVEVTGELVYHTKIYLWSDKTFHTTQEQPAFDADKHPSKL